MNVDIKSALVRWFVFAAICAAAIYLCDAGWRHALAAHWAHSSRPEIKLRAAEFEPANPELWYQLGRYRQLDFEHSDLRLAIAYYERAILGNPGSSSYSYWMHLAEAYDSSGNSTQAEAAFRKARELYPISAQAAWSYGNFLLRKGRLSEALRQIHDAIAIDPKLTPLAISRSWASIHDAQQILTVFPDNSEENWGMLKFFVQAREVAASLAVWKRIGAQHLTCDLDRVFPLVDMLIENFAAEEATRVWNQVLVPCGIQLDAGGEKSLVSNGGFERELLNGGFDWRLFPASGVKIGWDEQSPHSGRRALRMDFDGTSNPDFQNLVQYIAVEPAQRYRFSAFMRSEDVITESGVGFELQEVSPTNHTIRSTAGMVGTQPWSEQDLEFVTGSDTHILKVVLRRPAGERLNAIRGTVWVDDVALVPIAGSGGASH